MARDYARIMTAIWDNAGFLALSEPEQRAYLLLVTQPDISAAGVLSLRVRRWASMSSSSSPDALAQSLKQLEAARFIVIDHTTEELLIRSFIRWDAGFNNPKRRPVIVRAREEARSRVLKQHLDVEFKRCGLVPDPPPDGGERAPDPEARRAPDKQTDSLSGKFTADPGNDPFPQVESLSDSNALCDGVVVAYQEPSTPHPSDADASEKSARDHEDAATGQTALLPPGEVPPTRVAHHVAKAFADRHRPCNFHGVMGLAKQAVDAGYSGEAISAALERIAEAGRPITADTLRNSLRGRGSTTVQSITARAVTAADAAWDEFEARHTNVHQLPQRGA